MIHVVHHVAAMIHPAIQHGHNTIYDYILYLGYDYTSSHPAWARSHYDAKVRRLTMIHPAIQDLLGHLAGTWWTTGDLLLQLTGASCWCRDHAHDAGVVTIYMILVHDGVAKHPLIPWHEHQAWHSRHTCDTRHGTVGTHAIPCYSRRTCDTLLQ